jgi:MFS transporter, DHA2 family, multidrug resistance protein
VTAFNPATQQAVQTLTDRGFTVQQAYAYLEAALTQQSFIMAADDVFWAAGWFALLLVFVYWFARPPFMRGAAVPVVVD